MGSSGSKKKSAASKIDPNPTKSNVTSVGPAGQPEFDVRDGWMGENVAKQRFDNVQPTPRGDEQVTKTHPNPRRDEPVAGIHPIPRRDEPAGRTHPNPRRDEPVARKHPSPRRDEPVTKPHADTQVEKGNKRRKPEKKPNSLEENESSITRQDGDKPIATNDALSDPWINGSIPNHAVGGKKVKRDPAVSSNNPPVPLRVDNPSRTSNGREQEPIIFVPDYSQSYHEPPYDVTKTTRRDGVNGTQEADEEDEEEGIDNNTGELYQRDMSKRGKTSVRSAKGGRKWTLNEQLEDEALSQERDLWMMEHGSSRDDPSLNANKEFYKNRIKFKPKGELIEKIHKDWFGDYRRLEINHSYIQWLFPIPDSKGMNPDAQPLQFHEAMSIKENRIAKKRVLTSYKMMLDFYGMELADEKSGAIKRSKNWKERLSHLNLSAHNYRRITRIVKSIGILGFPHYTFPLVDFILHEAVVAGTLPNVSGPCKEFWIDAVVGAKERHILKETYGLSMDKTNFASPRILERSIGSAKQPDSLSSF